MCPRSGNFWPASAHLRQFSSANILRTTTSCCDTTAACRAPFRAFHSTASSLAERIANWAKQSLTNRSDRPASWRARFPYSRNAKVGQHRRCTHPDRRQVENFRPIRRWPVKAASYQYALHKKISQRQLFRVAPPPTKKKEAKL